MNLSKDRLVLSRCSHETLVYSAMVKICDFQRTAFCQSVNRKNLYSASYSPEQQHLTTKNTTPKI